MPTIDAREFFPPDWCDNATIAGVPVRCHFHRGYFDPWGAAVDALQIFVRCAEVDVPGVAQGAAVSVAGGSYKVADVQRGEPGFIVLQLETP